MGLSPALRGATCLCPTCHRLVKLKSRGRLCKTEVSPLTEWEQIKHDSALQALLSVCRNSKATMVLSSDFFLSFFEEGFHLLWDPTQKQQ